MNRIQNIKAFAMKKEAENMLKEANEQIELNRLAYEIEGLWDRAKELIEVANACLENGIDFRKDRKCLHVGKIYDTPEYFVSSAISHQVGFGAYSHGPVTFGTLCINHFNAISKRGGGASEYELDLCDGKVYYSGPDAKFAMERFLANFDEFETAFYAWIDNLTNF